MRQLPFVIQPKNEIVPIGTPETGIVHLLKRKAITPIENPVDFQEQQRKQIEVQRLLMTAVKRVAEKEQVSHAEARKRLFAAPINKEEGETAPDEISMYDYLEPDEISLVLGLQDSQREIAIRAATTMIQNRMAFPIVFDSVKANGKTASVKALPDDIPSGSRIRLDDGVFVETTDFSSSADPSLSIKSAPRPIKEGEVGYLCELGTSKVRFGWPDWSLKDTEEMVTEAQILALYQFYQSEAGVETQATSLNDDTVTGGEAEFDAGESSPLAIAQSETPSSTGPRFSSDSNGLDAEMNGSVPKTSEPALIG